MACSRNSRNTLGSLLVNGSRMEEPREVRAAVFNHFSRFFSEPWGSRPKLSGPFKNIGGAQAIAHLEGEFTEEEISHVIMTCEGNKAPGPDGFNLAFFKKCWNIVKSDVVNFMCEFHRNACFVGGINSSFIALIPKSDSPSSLNDYRPISLIGSLYKILAKVLSNRLKLVMPRIIGEVQSAFVGGQNILDGVLIANEIVDVWRKSKSKGLILKLDFKKAFDSVNWAFLFSMLSNFGFGNKWIKWIKACVSSAKISVLVNGSPTPEFHPQRGLRQGDPLSPFLFNIVAEALNILLSKAKELGLLKGAQVGSSGFSISHLQFADDTILFCEANWREVVNIKRILRCFELLSGLKINYHKSVISGVGVKEGMLHNFASRLNCLYHKLPLKY